MAGKGKPKKQVKTIGLNPEVWDLWEGLLKLDREGSGIPDLSWNAFMRRLAPTIRKNSSGGSRRSRPT